MTFVLLMMIWWMMHFQNLQVKMIAKSNYVCKNTSPELELIPNHPKDVNWYAESPNGELN